MALKRSQPHDLSLHEASFNPVDEDGYPTAIDQDGYAVEAPSISKSKRVLDPESRKRLVAVLDNLDKRLAERKKQRKG